MADLDAGLVRAIGRPEERFEEDHLRMLRGVRFASRFGFAIEEETNRAMRAQAGKISAVSRERARDELTKMLTEGQARRAFELLDETGLLTEVLPEVARMKGVEQPAQYHPEGDVWMHTLGLLGQFRGVTGGALRRGRPRWNLLEHIQQFPGKVVDGRGESGVGRATARCGQASDLPQSPRPHPI